MGNYKVDYDRIYGGSNNIVNKLVTYMDTISEYELNKNTTGTDDMVFKVEYVKMVSKLRELKGDNITDTYIDGTLKKAMLYYRYLNEGCTIKWNKEEVK